MSNTTTTQIVREDPEIEAYRLGLLEDALALSGKPVSLPQYQVSGLTGLQELAAQRAEEGVGAFIPFIQAGSEGIAAGQTEMYGAQPLLQQGIGQFDPTTAQQYMDPYMDEVVQSAMEDIQRQGDLERQRVGAQAVSAGAFGGSRQAIAEQELNRNLMDQMARTGSQLRSAGYQQALQQAQQGFESSMARNLQGAQQQAAIGQGLGTLGLQQASLGELQAKLGQTDLESLLNVGGIQYQQAQAALEADRQSQLQQAYEPYQRLSFLSDIYAKTPSAQQTLSVGTSPAVSPFQQIAGLGIAGLSAAAGASKAGLFG
mgnify:FL=1